MDDFREEDSLIVDLNTCEMEPIHTPDRIQRFGVMLAGPADMSEIRYCSSNIVSFLCVKPDDILGKPFSALFDEELIHATLNMISAATARAQRERVGVHQLSSGPFEIYAHLNADGNIVVELERFHPQPGGDSTKPIDRMRKLLAAAHTSRSTDQLLKISVMGLQALTGYDRVMAYRYEPNGDGVVVAEATDGLTSSYLGLRYPAWDIPEQARALQIKNPVRMVVDISQSPAPLLSLASEDPPLEMSLAHLRGVSPVHIEYLANMGVAATFSVGLVVGGKLWGMFACHHGTPKAISSDLRIAIELYGQMISLLIQQMQDVARQARKRKAAEARERVLAGTEAKADLLNAFETLAPVMSEVIDCDGLALIDKGKVLTYGSCPRKETIRAFKRHAREAEDLIAPFENLAQTELFKKKDLEKVGGALLIRAAVAYPLQVIYFRDKVTRTLNWAGKPEKEIETGPLGPRISPRQSFEAYVEKINGYCEPWTEADLAAARELQEMLSQITAKGERLQIQRHRDIASHQRQQDLMIAELNHRVKNILALIRSLSRQAKASSGSLDSYALALEQRIAALAAAHDLAVSDSMQGVSLRGILKTELDPYLAEDKSQVLMSGPLVGLRADVAPMVALVLHEVVSNAVKYGALSVSQGIVRVAWELEGDGSLRFDWQELNGPPVNTPDRHGFGRSLIEKAIPFELDGKASLEFPWTGVQFMFSLPAEALVGLDAETPVQLTPSVAEIERIGVNKTALLIEDNVVLAMDMVETLTRLGTDCVETASSIEAGKSLIEQKSFDFAILDMNLRGKVSFALAERLIERRMPFVFVTGYGSSVSVPDKMSSVPILTKPVDEGTLAKAIESVLERATAPVPVAG